MKPMRTRKRGSSPPTCFPRESIRRMRQPLVLLATAMFLTAPSAAYATSGEVPEALSIGAGMAALVAAVALLTAMLAVARIAEGAAIAKNIHYAVLAVVCLSASVLMGWIARWVPSFSVEHARLGADLLAVAAMALFGVYFLGVRLAMAHFLRRLTGEEQLLTAVISPDSSDQAPVAGDGE